MERVGYDADTQRYTFRSEDGTLYQSEPGSRYGDISPVGSRLPPAEIEKRNRAVESGHRQAVRTMLPFALIVLAFMFLLFKVINGGFGSDSGMTWGGHDGEQALDCAQGSHQIQIKKGDTCWAVAKEYDLKVDELLALDGNINVDCEKLGIGQGVCVPDQ